MVEIDDSLLVHSLSFDLHNFPFGHLRRLCSMLATLGLEPCCWMNAATSRSKLRQSTGPSTTLQGGQRAVFWDLTVGPREQVYQCNPNIIFIPELFCPILEIFQDFRSRLLTDLQGDVNSPTALRASPEMSRSQGS